MTCKFCNKTKKYKIIKNNMKENVNNQQIENENIHTEDEKLTNK